MKQNWLGEWGPSQHLNEHMGRLPNGSFESGVHFEEHEVWISLDFKFGNHKPNPLTFHVPVESFLKFEEEIDEYANEPEGSLAMDRIWEIHEEICSSPTLVFHFFEYGNGGEGFSWRGIEIKPFTRFLQLGLFPKDLKVILDLIRSKTTKSMLPLEKFE